MPNDTIRTDNSACAMCINCAHCKMVYLRGYFAWTCDSTDTPRDVMPYSRACAEFRGKIMMETPEKK